MLLVIVSVLPILIRVMMVIRIVPSLPFIGRVTITVAVICFEYVANFGSSHNCQIITRYDASVILFAGQPDSSTPVVRGNQVAAINHCDSPVVGNNPYGAVALFVIGTVLPVIVPVIVIIVTIAVVVAVAVSVVFVVVLPVETLITAVIGMCRCRSDHAQKTCDKGNCQ